HLRAFLFAGACARPDILPFPTRRSSDLTSGHFPYYRDAQYPPMYAHPAGSALDLAQHRLSAGPLDEKRELEMCQFMKLTNFHVPDRKSTRLNSSHVAISYAVTSLKKKTT